MRYGLGTVLLAVQIQAAAAFPLIDPANEGEVPQGTELAAPDAQELRHQLQLVNGLVPPPGGGWTFVPYVDVQAMLTDNALQAHQPREWDLLTYLSPGIRVAGDVPRLQLTFDYAPALALYMRNSSLNALTQQMNGVGMVTLVPDLLFVDLRAVAGVRNLYGGIGGLGTIGAAGPTAGMQQATASSLAGTAGAGLNRNEDVQTASFGISPYLLRQFGDWGTGKLGYSFNVTNSNQMTGFVAAPFPTGGSNRQTLITNEEIAHFATGEILQSVQNSIDVDLLQSQTTTGTGYAAAVTAANVPGTNGLAQSFTSIRNYVSDKVTYQANRTVAVFVSGGHEDITYGRIGAQDVHDLTWSFGTTLTPSPDTTLTLSYGHLNGYNSFTVDGHIAVTPRTTLAVSYGSTSGTQLEYLQNQLNLATYNANGTLVNGQTGGPLFAGTNALAVQSGVFRTDTLTISSQTVLDRDSLSAILLLTTQTNLSGGAASKATGKTTGKTITAQWLHQMRPDLTLSAAASFSVQDGNAGFGGPGNTNSVAASIGLQYLISDTLSASLRYSFFDRQSSSVAFSFYQNMLILGISKSF